jgi:hypothetical protein
MTPFVGESTEVLRRGQIGLTGAGGLGAMATDVGKNTSSGEVAGAGEVRVRVGIGGRQEVGLTGFGGVGSTSGSNSSVPYEIGGKLSYKVAPSRWFAFVTSGGAFDESQIAAFGGDLAAIVAPYADRAGDQFYTGAKGSVAVPVMQNARGVTEALTLPIGYAFRSSDDVRVFLEGGAVVGFAQLYDANQPLTTGGTTALGGYGVVAVRVLLH